MFPLFHPQEQPSWLLQEHSHSLLSWATVAEEMTSNRVTLKIRGSRKRGSTLLHHHS